VPALLYFCLIARLLQLRPQSIHQTAHHVRAPRLPSSDVVNH